VVSTDEAWVGVSAAAGGIGVLGDVSAWANEDWFVKMSAAEDGAGPPDLPNINGAPEPLSEFDQLVATHAAAEAAQGLDLCRLRKRRNR